MKTITPDEFNAIRGEYRGKYDYDTILDGTPRLFTSGEDFNGKPTNFVNCIKAAAKKRGVEVEIKTEDTEVYVWAQPDGLGA